MKRLILSLSCVLLCASLLHGATLNLDILSESHDGKILAEFGIQCDEEIDVWGPSTDFDEILPIFIPDFQGATRAVPIAGENCLFLPIMVEEWAINNCVLS